MFAPRAEDLRSQDEPTPQARTLEVNVGCPPPHTVLVGGAVTGERSGEQLTQSVNPVDYDISIPPPLVYRSR